jgi:hypothetical protein
MNRFALLRSRSVDIAVIAAAMLIRSVAWNRLHGPIMAGDGSFYLQLGAEIGRGRLSGLAEWPFHALYAFTLAPAYLLALPVATYIAVLHILLSTVTVLILMRTAEALSSSRYAILVGAAAAVNPFFLQWLPYVLTETFFFCVFAAYAYTVILLLKQPSWIRAGTYAVAAVAAVLSRPVALPVAAVTTCMIILVWVDRAIARPALDRRFAILTGVALALLIAGAGLFALARPRLMTLPTVVQGLWASTVLRVGNMDDVRAFGARDEQVDSMFAGRLTERDRYKIAEALAYIRTNPRQYLAQAAVKVVSFFFPWVFAANAWSPAHRAIDAVFSIFLVAGALLALGSEKIARLHTVMLLTMALTLALLSAFSLMDPDGRYRVPAEVLLLPLAPAGWILASSRLVGRRGSRVGHSPVRA